MYMAEAIEPLLTDADRQNFLDSVIASLAQSQKSLPTAYLYDARGSALFEEITVLEEYYQTRTEIGILQACSEQWGASLLPDTVLVEFGSGSSVKTELLLSSASAIKAYAPIDVSPAALEGAEKRLATKFPDLKVVPVIGDFKISELPLELQGRPCAGFFPGSTIGNFTPDEAAGLLRSFAHVLGHSSPLLIGIDLRKDTNRLIAAYDDAQDVTAAFNLNMLRRINRELDADFNLSAFKHTATYDTHHHRIEMHLVSQKEQTVSIAGKAFSFAEGESIHTENSYKYTIDGFRELAQRAGWHPEEVWTDSEALFSVHALRAP